MKHTKSTDVPENMRMSLTDYCRQMRSADDETTEFGDEHVDGPDRTGEGSGIEADVDTEMDERTDES